MGSGPEVRGDEPNRAVEGSPGRREVSSEDAREAERGGGLVVFSETVALVCAFALVGGGICMLVGVALGAINPFALGIAGVVAGTGLAIFLARGPWWRRVFGR